MSNIIFKLMGLVCLIIFFINGLWCVATLFIDIINADYFLNVFPIQIIILLLSMFGCLLFGLSFNNEKVEE